VLHAGEDGSLVGCHGVVGKIVTRNVDQTCGSLFALTVGLRLIVPPAAACAASFC
jgi:hypothetical protein